MNELESRVLGHLVSRKGTSLDYRLEAKELGLSESAYASAAESLYTSGLAEKVVEKHEELKVGAKGKPYVLTGLPETRLLEAVNRGARTLLEAIEKSKLSNWESGIALGMAVKAGLVQTSRKAEGSDLELVSKAKENPAEVIFQSIAKGDDVDKASHAQKHLIDNLVGRGLVEVVEQNFIYHAATPAGRKAAATGAKGSGSISQLTPQMLQDGSWKDREFRPYDLSTVAVPVGGLARKHAYKEFLNNIRLSLVGLGFREIGGPLVELEFWNMDALFMPQDHPAREIHDVFRLKEPSMGRIPDEAIFKEMVAAHHHGGNTGSKGWGYQMSRESSQRLLPRSHDTGISARELAKGNAAPDRVFFITRVFRPDEIDWKHFIEFNQLGGYVAGDGISLRDLLGTLKTFAQQVFGAKEVKFVPSYFPFTEPSVEMYANIPGRGWAEVGGAGMFRPEMLSALGVDHPVVAWGLGIDRLAMLTIGINDIRDLHSHDIEFLRSR